MGADGEFVVGEAAERRGTAEPARVVRDFKRRLGDRLPILVGGAAYSPQALMARVMSWVLAAVERREGEPPEGVVLTHPANWGPFKRELFGQAIRLADLDRTATLTEPEAAAILYASRNRLADGACIGVYDLGGGTFNAAVLRRAGAGFESLGVSEGIERLGGVDFDEAVFGHVLRALDIPAAVHDSERADVRAAMARLRRNCVEAKESLSTDSAVTVEVALPDVQTEVRVTRAEFEDMVRPSLQLSVGAMHRALDSAGVTASDLTALVLIGGSSRIPLVGQLLTAEFDRPLALDTHSKHDVALGAALASRTLLPHLRSYGAAALPVEATPGTRLVTSGSQGSVTGVAADDEEKPVPGPHAQSSSRTARRLLVGGIAAVVVVALVLSVVRWFGREDVSLPLPVSAPLPSDVYLAASVGNSDAEILRASVNSTEVEQLTDAEDAINTDPTMSPDRRTIIYVQQDELGNPERSTLRVMAADGSGDRELFTAADRPCDDARRPGWSPDGSLLVILCLDEAQQKGLWIVEPDGSPVRKLAVPDNADNASWSRNGVIAYSQPAAGEGEMLNDIVITARIAVIGPEAGATPRVITDEPGVLDRSPQWSPDGSRLMFIRAGNDVADIWVMNADGTAAVPVTDVQDVLSAVWGPDNEIAYTRRIARGAATTLFVRVANDAEEREIRLPGALASIVWVTR